MATITTAVASGQEGEGDLHLSIFEFTPNDVTYPTGGYPISLDGPILAVIGNLPGYVTRFDAVNAKLLLYRQTAATGALVEVPNATDLSALGASRLVAVIVGS